MSAKGQSGEQTSSEKARRMPGVIAMEGVEPNNDATSLLVKEEEEPSNVTEVKAQAPTNQDRIIYSAQVFNIKDKLSLEKHLPQDI